MTDHSNEERYSVWSLMYITYCPL